MGRFADVYRRSLAEPEAFWAEADCGEDIESGLLLANLYLPPGVFCHSPQPKSSGRRHGPLVYDTARRNYARQCLVTDHYRNRTLDFVDVQNHGAFS